MRAALNGTLSIERQITRTFFLQKSRRIPLCAKTSKGKTLQNNSERERERLKKTQQLVGVKA